VLLCAGLLGSFATRELPPYAKLVPLLCLIWWGSGWAKGFGLFEKWPKEERRDAQKNIPIVFTLMLIGNLLHFHGCGIGDLRASAEGVASVFASAQSAKATAKVEAESKWRDLGKLAAPSSEIMTRLRLDAANRAAEGVRAQKAKAALDGPILKQIAEIQKDPISHVQKQRIRELQKSGQDSGVIAQTSNAFLYKTWDGSVVRWTVQGGTEEIASAPPQNPSVSASWATIAAASGWQPVGTRKGPFCRVTCSFHHNDGAGVGTGDVEVDADYCKTGKIDPSLTEVMGWIAIDAQYEVKNPWPGPAGGGLDSYKLYWK
jgi:hypothetical protein